MTNETRERIKYYMSQLPKTKEKLVAAIMMLVIAASVTVTATYAWITLSTAPEATSIDTTVAANGSLEIALATGKGAAPGNSKVGDSSAAERPEGVDAIRDSNITWGNLVNLSDDFYGLGNITLRPAALNGSSGLLSNPLYGVEYGEDGRISNMLTGFRFAYTYFDKENEKFVADYDDSNLGVRAISSVMYGNITGNKVYDTLASEYTELYQQVQENYQKMANDKTHIATLQGLITKYAQSMLDGTTDETKIIVTEYADGLYDLMNYLNESVMKPLGETYVKMANMLDLLHEQGSHTGAIYSSVDDLVDSVNELPAFFSQVTVNGKSFSNSLQEFASDYKSIQIYTLKGNQEDFGDLSDTQQKNSLAYWAYLAPTNQVTWSNISKCIEWACSIKTATLNGMKLNELKSALYNGGDINWEMAGQLMGANNDAVLNDGAIRDLEERIETSMAAPIKVSVKYKITIDVSATLRTSASDSTNANWGQVKNEYAYIESLYTGSVPGDQIIAKDTYAMAIDLWVRTNAGAETPTVEESEPNTLEDGRTEKTVTTTFEQAYLTLEAPKKVLGKEYIKETVTDINGNKHPAYVASYTLNGEAAETIVFFRYDGYYYITEGKEYNFENELKKQNGEELPADLTYTEKVAEKEIIIGYQGANRVWSEEQMDGMIDVGDTSSTQGTGSCYVFYANTPADQSRFLELLQSMKVAFVDANGKLKGLAYFDTENYIQESGKVTVPMALSASEAIDLGDELAIMPLNKNEATRLTALIYLDGKQLTNEMVLASGEVQGTINIQFSSSASVATTTSTTITSADGKESSTITKTDYSGGTDSSAIEEDKMMSEIVRATAIISAEDDSSGTLTVNVEGIDPKKATAGFVRAINSTQGVLQDYIELSGEDGTWTGKYQFNKPGNYILRSVKLDGVEYDLEEPVSIKIEGNAVDSVACDAITDGSRRATLMTSESYVSTVITLGYASDDSETKYINGIFRDEHGRQVSVRFIESGPGQWKGTAKFTTDGTYTLEYIEVGEEKDIYPIDESLQVSLEIYVGVEVGVWFSIKEPTMSNLQLVLPGATATRFVLSEEVTIDVNALIYNNKGEVIKGLSTAILHYGRSGAAVGVSGLDTNLAWNSESGYYTGEFKLRKNMAGTYQFSHVEIDSDNLIYSYTEASNIQAMSDGDVAYDSHSTESYQYAPQFDAKMLVNMEYSSAADYVEATVKKDQETKTVVGTRGVDVKDNVTQWSFPLPIDKDGKQEGDWQLTSLTAYGVYYENKYCEQVTFDVSSENITTHVVNKIYVTLDFGTESPEPEIEFMTDNEIGGMSVTIADYQGNPVGYYNDKKEVDVNISDVQVIYNAPTAASIKETGYTLIKGSGAEDVSADAKLQNGSGTNYTVGEMNFKYAGTYNSARVEFGAKLNNNPYEPAIEKIYKVNGRVVSVVPEYRVQWTKPVVQISGVSNNIVSESFSTTSADVNSLQSVDVGKNDNLFQRNVINWHSDYIATMYLKFNTSERYVTAETPTLELTISAVGNFTKASLEIANGLGKGKAQTYSFTKNQMSDNKNIGMVANDNENSGIIGIGSGWWKIVSAYEVAGENTVTKISISGDENTWETNLQSKIQINQYGVSPELTFTGLSSHEANGAVTPSDIKTSSSGVTLSTDGSNSFTCTLPDMQTWTKTYDKVISLGATETQYRYKTRTETSNCNTTTYYDVYECEVATSEVGTETYSYTDTYISDSWKINGNWYPAGSSDFKVSGRWSAEAKVTCTVDDSPSLINRDTVAAGTIISEVLKKEGYTSEADMKKDFNNVIPY